MVMGSQYLDNNISRFIHCSAANIPYRSTELKVHSIQYMLHDYLGERAYFNNSYSEKL